MHGLGVALVVQATQAGFKVYTTMRNLARRGTLDKVVQAAGVAVEFLELDVQKSDTIQAAVDTILVTDDQIDVLINNADAGFVRAMERASEAEINGALDVKFMDVVCCTKGCMPHTCKCRSGQVIRISSVGELIAQPFNEIYCAAKFAVEGFTESLACISRLPSPVASSSNARYPS
ncbi:SDR family NAD(P)-dependent oxidoreductase [Actibacterium sp. 188UL27-1]|uniref:SDR family NAD(P)-dependent oxidoreductase n=1 Tax=Actibacterium sp. 188UL27-1 TaxID=2786961 RepID=UPI001EF65D85|nr:SDR family NAD(P)-dependent oxidoreductase [Actibacterium sp. 188UL27-1]